MSESSNVTIERIMKKLNLAAFDPAGCVRRIIIDAKRDEPLRLRLYVETLGEIEILEILTEDK